MIESNINNDKVFPNLENTIHSLNTATISKERKARLQPLIDFIQSKIKTLEPININFICTHNSRRSQLAQIWAQTMAYYFGIEIQCFSGGVEATAFNNNAVEAIVRAGFDLQKNGHPNNPIYQIFYVKGKSPILVFSKLLDDPTNPKTNFAAIMTCSDADENCPIIHGAEVRIAIRYEDPKAFDNTPKAIDMYDNLSKKIATEMYYIFSQIKN